MKTQSIIAIALASTLLLPTGFVVAADQATERERIQAQEQEQIYGSQMMTEQERNEYRARIKAAKTNQEREQIRMEHHERMMERAKAQGLSMPEAPPKKGTGMGSGKGVGGGYGGGKGGGKNDKK